MVAKRSCEKSKDPLGPPPSGHGDFWATVHVKLAHPIADVYDPTATPAQGYYRNFGVRSPPSLIAKVLEAAITDGVIDWPESEVSLVNPSDLDRDIRARIVSVQGQGIWYRSGRILYADPDLEPPPS